MHKVISIPMRCNQVFIDILPFHLWLSMGKVCLLRIQQNVIKMKNEMCKCFLLNFIVFIYLNWSFLRNYRLFVLYNIFIELLFKSVFRTVGQSKTSIVYEQCSLQRFCYYFSYLYTFVISMLAFLIIWFQNPVFVNPNAF